jgi:predicted metal-dependent HD superfamily phosphohydrolase
VYDTLKSNNEEKSANLAERRMEDLEVSEEIVARVVEMILATKTHVVSENQDINYFTDADLSILGKDWEVYNQYAKQVRNEYAIYPDLLYNPGRKKVLKHFLEMNQIYKTDYFTQKYEEQARLNLSRELEGDRV